MRFESIQIAKIAFAPANLAARPLPSEKDKDYDEFLDLKEDINLHGVLDLPTFRQEGDIFVVTNGNRRMTALQQLVNEGRAETLERYPDGMITVPVVDMTDIEGLERQIAGNATVRKQLPTSLAKAVYKLVTLSGGTVPEIAKKCGYSEQRMMELMKLNNLPEAVKVLVDAGSMSVVNALQLLKLPVELQEGDWVEAACIQNGTDYTAAVAKKLSDLRAEKRAAKDPTQVAQFMPTPAVLKKDELAVMLQRARNDFDTNPSEYNRGVKETMERIFTLDEVSVAAAKAKWEKDQADAKVKKEERAAARDAAKVEEAKKVLADHGMAINL
jgi:hypothetical protein